MPNITHKIATPVDADDLFDAISTLEGLRNWWTTDVEGSPEVGGTLAFRFGGGGPDMEIEVMEPNRVVWRCTVGPDEWIGTHIEFSLKAEEEGKTALYFTHRGWEKETPFHYHCSMKWASFLLSLKSYVEFGLGTPFPSDIQIESRLAKSLA